MAKRLSKATNNKVDDVFKLPTQKTIPSADFTRVSVTMYGPPKIGKSMFWSKAKNALFLTTEPAHKHLSILNQPIEKWLDFKRAVAELHSGGYKNYSTVVIDTIDILYTMCLKYVCAKRGIDHPADQAYGKGWKALREEFEEQLCKLTRLPGIGVAFISHSVEREIEGREEKYVKTQSTMTEHCRGVINPLSDIIVYCGFAEDGKTRIAIMRPSHDLEAGSRYLEASEFYSAMPAITPFSYEVFIDTFQRCMKGETVEYPGIEKGDCKKRVTQPTINRDVQKLTTTSKVPLKKKAPKRRS